MHQESGIPWLPYIWSLFYLEMEQWQRLRTIFNPINKVERPGSGIRVGRPGSGVEVHVIFSANLACKLVK